MWIKTVFKKIIEAISNQTKSINNLARPYVIVDAYPKRSINMLYFRIRNVGKTPAYNIAVQPKEEIPFRKHSSSDLLIFQNPISAIGPGEEIAFFYDSAIELFSKENPVLSFPVTAEYSDANKNYYKEDFLINVEIFKGLSIDLPTADRIIKELERIQRDIEKLSRSVERVVQYELTKEQEKIAIEQDQPNNENITD